MINYHLSFGETLIIVYTIIHKNIKLMILNGIEIKTITFNLY
jgi:hypothetical protein